MGNNFYQDLGDTDAGGGMFERSTLEPPAGSGGSTPSGLTGYDFFGTPYDLTHPETAVVGLDSQGNQIMGDGRLRQASAVNPNGSTNKSNDGSSADVFKFASSAFGALAQAAGAIVPGALAASQGRGYVPTFGQQAQQQAQAKPAPGMSLLSLPVKIGIGLGLGFFAWKILPRLFSGVKRRNKGR